MLAGRRCWSFEDVRVSSPIARSTPSPQPVSLACDTLPGPVSECPRHWCGGGAGAQQAGHGAILFPRSASPSPLSGGEVQGPLCSQLEVALGTQVAQLPCLPRALLQRSLPGALVPAGGEGILELQA